MNNRNGTENVVTKKIIAFLTDKPVWVWWIFHILVTGVIFGVSYMVLYLLAIQWWAGVLILFAAGMIWGSIRYFQTKGKIKAESYENVKPA